MSGTVSPPPGGPTPPGGAPGPGTPPIGSSPATGPSQNLGATAQGNQIVQMLLTAMAMALTKLPPGTKLAQAVSKAHTEIGKELDPGAASSAGVTNAMKMMAAKHAQMAPQAGAMATQAGMPGAKPSMPPPAAPPPGAA